jgi:hypothetical protein
MEQKSGVRLYVETHEGVLSLRSGDGGRTWTQGPITLFEHAAAKIAASSANGDRAYLAAYESGMYRTDDGGESWRHLDGYPTEHAYSVVVDQDDPDTVYVGSEPAMVFRTHDGGETWEACEGIARVPEASTWSFHWEGRHAHVRDLALAPGKAGWLYAGIEVGGLVRSKDGGETLEALAGTDSDVHTRRSRPPSRARCTRGRPVGPSAAATGARAGNPSAKDSCRLRRCWRASLRTPLK